MEKGTKLVNKHSDKMTAIVTDVCSNGSLKVILTDLTAPSAKLRKPKNYTIQKAFIVDWKTI